MINIQRFITMLLCISFVTQAQAQKFEWIGAFGGPLAMGTSNNAIDINTNVVDKAGNVYISGSFRDTSDFNPGTGVFTLIPLGGNQDACVLKLDANGNFVWALGFGGSGIDVVWSSALDTLGNLFITGTYANATSFTVNTVQQGTVTISGASSFVAKITPEGVIDWMKSIGDNNTGVTVRSIHVDIGNNVVFGGWFHRNFPADFDPGPNIYNIPNWSSGSVQTGFICKWSNSGDFIWVKGMIGGANDRARVLSLHTDKSGNVVYGGNFVGKIDFDPGTAVTDTFFMISTTNPPTSAILSDLFIAKLDRNGNFMWANRLGGNGNTDNSISGVVTNGDNEIYATGGFTQSLSFDTFNFVNIGSGSDIINVKMDSAGNYIWASQVGEAGDAAAFSNGISIDKHGYIYTTGSFKGVLDFNTNPNEVDTISAQDPAPGNIRDIFIHKMTAGGSHIWVHKLLAGAESNYGRPVAIDYNDNSVHFAGKFYHELDVHLGGNIITLTPPNTNYVSYYALKLSCGDTTLNLSVSACYSYIFGNEIYTSSGTYAFLYRNATGCDSTIILDLTISSPDAQITVNENVLGTTQPYASYQWLRGSQKIDGATDSFYIVTENNDYSVAVTTPEGCRDTSDVIAINNLSVSDMQSDIFVRVYPNPAQGTIKITAGKPLTDAVVKVYNLVGQTVLSEGALNGTQHQVDIHRLMPGIYTVEITERNQAVRIKVIKE